MAKLHLSNDNFFLRLSELFDVRRQKDHGSVFLTQKRMTHSEDIGAAEGPTISDPFPDLNPSKPLPIIIRATDGNSKDKKVRLSTLVEADMLEGFFVRYAEVCKLGMSGLKKRDRSKRKEKMKAKKKKGGAEEVKKA